MIRSKKRQTQVLALLIIVLFFMLGLALLNQKQAKPSFTTAPKEDSLSIAEPETPPSLTLNEFKRNSSKNGKVVWELVGTQADFFSSENKVKIKNPDLNLNQNNRTTKILADSALVSFDDQNIEQADLNQNVSVKNSQLDLKTPKAILRQKENRLYAPNEVFIKTSTAELYGIELEADLSKDEFEIFKEVDSKFMSAGLFEQSDSNKLTKITAEYLKYNKQTGNFRYLNDVKATQEAHTIFSDSLIGQMNENEELVELEAEGNVVIHKGTEMQAKGAHAKFDFERRRITLSGKPELTREKNTIVADIIHYYTETGESRAEGNVSVKMLSKE